MAAAAILFLIASSQNYSDHRIYLENHTKFECNRINGKYVTVPTSFLGGHLFLNGCGSHFVFNGFIPKANQIIRNTWRTTIPNLNAIQPMVHKLLCPQGVPLFRRPSWKVAVYRVPTKMPSECKEFSGIF